MFIENLLGLSAHIYFDNPTEGEPRIWLTRSLGGVQFRLAKCRVELDRSHRTTKDHSNGFQPTGERPQLAEDRKAA